MRASPFSFVPFPVCSLNPVASHHQRPSKCAPTRAEAASLISCAIKTLQPAFAIQDDLTKGNISRVLSALRTERIGQHHFVSPDGYAHGDLGREALDAVYAHIFNCEAALVRVQYLSGTHAIASVLYGVLRPGDELVSVAGPVYDTLEEVIGLRESSSDAGSLRDFDVSFREVSLRPDGGVDLEAIQKAIKPQTKVAFIQRSFGYAWRSTLSNADIAAVILRVRASNPACICFVDNCYGEFTEPVEPVHASIGADVMAGSLIKNLGGGIAPAGAYVAGRADIVHKARARLAAPGVGGGATLGLNRTLFQGLFLAPGMVGEACKGSLLLAEVMRILGYETNPQPGERGFVRAVRLGDRERVVRFCRAVQRNGPVGAYIEPTVGLSDGYASEVVFAQGTFIDGSTLELSADGPLREPFAVFAQGGLHWTHWAIVLEDIVMAIGYSGEDLLDEPKRFG